MRTLISSLVLAALAASTLPAGATPCVHGAVAPANGTCFDTYRRPTDGKIETYYAPRGSRLERGLRLLSARWDPITAASDWWRIDDDLPYLPPELAALGHGGAITTARSLQLSLATRRYASQLPGMAPAFSQSYWQLISRPLGFATLLAWPTDAAFPPAAAANASATQRYHGGGVPGFFGYVNAITGLADNPLADYYCEGAPVAWLASIGQGMQGMTTIALATGHAELLAWITAKLDFIDAHALGSYPDAFLPDKWHSDGVCLNEGPSSDNMYFARALYGAADALGPQAHGDQASLRTRMLTRANAMALGWGARAVLSNGLFATHMEFDGTPHDQATNGDTKWNALYLMAEGTRHVPARAPTFLALARDHYQALRANAVTGLIDDTYTDDGDPTTPDGDGVIEADAVFVAMALLELHRAAQGVTLPAGMAPDYFQRAALGLLDAIYARRGEGAAERRLLDNGRNGDAVGFTQVALGEGIYQRLAIDTPAGGSGFAIASCSSWLVCGTTILTATLPTYSRVAVALLPQGMYRVTVGGTARFITLTSNQTLTF